MEKNTDSKDGKDNKAMGGINDKGGTQENKSTEAMNEINNKIEKMVQNGEITREQGDNLKQSIQNQNSQENAKKSIEKVNNLGGKMEEEEIRLRNSKVGKIICIKLNLAKFTKLGIDYNNANKIQIEPKRIDDQMAEQKRIEAQKKCRQIACQDK